MTYRVVITDEVLAAIDAQIAWYIDQGVSRDLIGTWLAELVGKVNSLRELPKRFGVAETVSRIVGHEVRRMNHGEHALFYRVRDQERIVEVLAFRHGRRRPWLEGG